MLKRLVLLAALLGASGLFAEAFPIGRNRNGYPLIVPQPHRLEARSGAFELPGKLTVSAPAALDLAPLAKIYTQTVPGGTVERAGTGALCRFELAEENVPESPEGYTIDLSPEGIAVKARDVRGLFYGMQTLNWILRNRPEAATLPCCAIVDRPDLKMRGFTLELRRSTPADVDRICHVIDTVGALKYNYLFIRIYDNFPYTDTPFVKRKSTLSRTDYEKILAAAKRNHMEVVPMIKLVSHAKWFDTHKDWPKMREGGSQCYCPSDPETQKLVEQMVREISDLLKPKIFGISLDEIEQNGFPACPKCKSAPAMEVLLRHLMPVKRILADRGIVPMVCQDQFFGFGEPRLGKGLGITKLPEKLGMDTVIQSWEYGPTSPMIGRRVKARGFEHLLYCAFGVYIDNAQYLPKNAFAVGAEGCLLAVCGMVPPTVDRPWGGRCNFYPAFIAHSNYAWNASDDDLARIPIDSARIFWELIDGVPERQFRGKATPVKLDGVFNRAITEDSIFPQLGGPALHRLREIVAADPAKFDLRFPDVKLQAVVLSGCREDGFATKPVRIPIGTTATGASFLMNGAIFDNYAPPWDFNKNTRDIPVGRFRVVYADPETKPENIPVTLRRTFNDWNTYIGGTFSRAVARAADIHGELVSFYALDWRNPKPEKEIKEIVFSAKGNTGIAPILYALSLSDAAKTPAGAPGEPRIAAPARREEAKRTVVLDFADGMPKGVQTEGKDIKGFACEVVYDTQEGKVLEMRMPEISCNLARGAVNLPIRNPGGEFKSVVFRIKVSDYRAIWRPDCYLKNPARSINALGIFTEIDDNWHTVCLPLERFVVKKGVEFPLEKINMIRFGFFMRDVGRPCTIRIGRIEFCDRVLPTRANAEYRAPSKKTEK